METQQVVFLAPMQLLIHDSAEAELGQWSCAMLLGRNPYWNEYDRYMALILFPFFSAQKLRLVHRKSSRTGLKN